MLRPEALQKSRSWQMTVIRGQKVEQEEVPSQTAPEEGQEVQQEAQAVPQESGG